MAAIKKVLDRLLGLHEIKILKLPFLHPETLGHYSICTLPEFQMIYMGNRYLENLAHKI
jgi:hypothetical protein